jgi:hypothetical protein
LLLVVNRQVKVDQNLNKEYGIQVEIKANAVPRWHRFKRTFVRDIEGYNCFVDDVEEVEYCENGAIVGKQKVSFRKDSKVSPQVSLFILDNFFKVYFFFILTSSICGSFLNEYFYFTLILLLEDSQRIVTYLLFV